MSDFILGLGLGLGVSWLLWDSWSFGWTLRHGVRADLFSLPREDVLDEFCWAVRDRATVVQRRAAMQAGAATGEQG